MKHHIAMLSRNSHLNLESNKFFYHVEEEKRMMSNILKFHIALISRDTNYIEIILFF